MALSFVGPLLESIAFLMPASTLGLGVSVHITANCYTQGEVTSQ